MGVVRVRFIRGTGFVSDSIARLTGSLFSHVEFGTPDKTWVGAHLKGGIQERPYNYCNPKINYYYEVPCSDVEEIAHLSRIRSKIGSKYDWLDIVGLAFQMRNVHRLHEYICSEFYGDEMLTIYGPKRFLNVQSGWTYRLTPETGHMSPLLAGNRK